MQSTTPRKVRIHVTQDDIAHGMPVSHCNCPVARAIKRKLHADEVSVSPTDTTQVTAFFRYRQVYYALPEEARRFINAFDNHGKPLPFSFDLVEVD